VRACDRCVDGRRDYGSKHIDFAWDGSPLAINADGSICADDDIGPVHASPMAKPYKGYGAPIYAPSSPAPADDYSSSGDKLGAILPGLSDRVACPAPSCGLVDTVTARVIHLNDVHKWTREAIADWLETLDADLSFPMPTMSNTV
jgi:hypothetical protein